MSTPSEIDSISLSFDQIEQIIDGKLPASHLGHRQWWENQKDYSNRPQARAWLEADFSVEEVKLARNGGWVRFRRAT